MKGRTNRSNGFGDQFRLAMRRHRRLLAAGLVAVAALLVFRGLQPAAMATVSIVVAAADLPAGYTIEPGDISLAQWPASFANGSAFTNSELAIGRVTSGPLVTGEPISASRIVSPGLLDLGYRGKSGANGSTVPGSGAATSPVDLVAAPVRLADAGEAALLKAGDFVDVLAASSAGIGADSDHPTTGGAQTVASSVQVIVVPDSTQSTSSGLLGGNSRKPASSGDAGSMIVLAVDPTTASTLAGAATRSRLSVVLRPTPK